MSDASGNHRCPACGEPTIDNLGDGESLYCLACSHAWIPGANDPPRAPALERPDDGSILSELASILHVEEWSALIVRVAELVRERDRYARRIVVLEKDLARIRAITEGKRT